MIDSVSVTIGIPFYNARRTLADSVRSVFAQTHADWELLLVDDGSTDGSLDIARSITEARVRSVSDGVHRGLVYRLNQIATLWTVIRRAFVQGFEDRVPTTYAMVELDEQAGDGAVAQSFDGPQLLRRQRFARAMRDQPPP